MDHWNNFYFANCAGSDSISVGSQLSMMIFLTIVLWIVAILYAYANGKRLIDQLEIFTRGKDTWIGSENIFLLAAIIASVVDIVLLVILVILYLLKALLQIM